MPVWSFKGLKAASFQHPPGEGPVPIRPLSAEAASQFLKELRSLYRTPPYAVLFEFTQRLPDKALAQAEGWFYSFQNTRRQRVWRLYLPASQEDVLVKNSLEVDSLEAYAHTGSSPTRLSLEALFQPLGPYNPFSLYDLTLLFLHWPSAYYEGSGRILGRKAHAYLLYPPSTVASYTGPIRVYLDAHFFTLLKAEWLDASGRSCLRSLQVLSFQKLSDGNYFIKALELKDCTAHTQTRCTFQALQWDLPPSAILEDLSRPPPFIF